MAKPDGDVTAYVFRSVRNAAIDLARARMRDRTRTVSLFETPESDGIHGVNSILALEDAEQTRQLIDSLPSAAKEIVVLKIFAGLTFEETGAVLGKSPKTVATQYRRALHGLRARFAPQANP